MRLVKSMLRRARSHFNGPLQPVELANRVVDEMDGQVQIFDNPPHVGEYIPNLLCIYTSRADSGRWRGAEHDVQNTISERVDAGRKKLAARLMGPLGITLLIDDDLLPGEKWIAWKWDPRDGWVDPMLTDEETTGGTKANATNRRARSETVSKINGFVRARADGLTSLVREIWKDEDRRLGLAAAAPVFFVIMPQLGVVWSAAVAGVLFLTAVQSAVGPRRLALPIGAFLAVTGVGLRDPHGAVALLVVGGVVIANRWPSGAWVPLLVGTALATMPFGLAVLAGYLFLGAPKVDKPVSVALLGVTLSLLLVRPDLLGLPMRSPLEMAMVLGVELRGVIQEGGPPHTIVEAFKVAVQGLQAGLGAVIAGIALVVFGSSRTRDPVNLAKLADGVLEAGRMTIDAVTGLALALAVLALVGRLSFGVSGEDAVAAWLAAVVIGLARVLVWASLRILLNLITGPPAGAPGT